MRKMLWDEKRRAWINAGISRRSVLLVVMCAALPLGAATRIDLTQQVQGILPSANGGTGSAFFGISGPTALRAFALPDANSTILTSNAAVTVGQGGTGVATLAAHGVVIGNGSGTVAVSATGTTNQCFMGNTGADPTWQSCPGTINFASAETPGGVIDGANATFTLANTPTSSSLQLYKNGQLMSSGAGNDYTLSTSTITMLTGAIPKSGDVLKAYYRF